MTSFHWLRSTPAQCQDPRGGRAPNSYLQAALPVSVVGESLVPLASLLPSALKRNTSPLQ